MHPRRSRPALFVRSAIGALVLVAVLSGGAGVGICNGFNTDLIGCWQNESPNDIGVTLKVTADAAELDFSGLACEAAGEFIGADENGALYYVRAPIGGSLQGGCAKFREAQMILTLNRDGSLLMHIAKPSKQLDEQVTLIKKGCR